MTEILLLRWNIPGAVTKPKHNAITLAVAHSQQFMALGTSASSDHFHRPKRSVA